MVAQNTYLSDTYVYDPSVLLKVRTLYFLPKRLDCISLEDNFLSSMSSALLQVV